VSGASLVDVLMAFYLTRAVSASFHMFFNQIDNFRTDYFLWVTAGGIDASHERAARGTERIPKGLEAELGDEADGVVEDAN
jgi:tRNA pseudouridine38-40 synthase